MEIQIRQATAKDLPWIVQELQLFARQYDSKLNLFGNSDYVYQGLLETLQKHLLLVAERDEKLLGFISGIVTPHLYNPNIRWLAELFWWVAEDARGTAAASLLMDEFIAWGKSNVDMITFGITEKRRSMNRA